MIKQNIFKFITSLSSRVSELVDESELQANRLFMSPLRLFAISPQWSTNCGICATCCQSFSEPTVFGTGNGLHGKLMMMFAMVTAPHRDPPVRQSRLQCAFFCPLRRCCATVTAVCWGGSPSLFSPGASCSNVRLCEACSIICLSVALKNLLEAFNLVPPVTRFLAACYRRFVEEVQRAH